MITRREFSKVLLATGTTTMAPGSESPTAAESPVPAAPQNTNQICDLLIKGGTVIDPSQRLHGPMDVAVKDRKILEVSQDIPESRALQVYSAKDRIVTPGFIDLHVHCFDGVATGFNADHYCLSRGVTTVVDAGSTGFPMVGAFIKHIVRPSNTRIHPLVEIGPLGTLLYRLFPMNSALNIIRSSYNMDWVVPELVTKAAMDNRPDTVGIKIHLSSMKSSEFEVELLKRALEAAGGAHLPLMVHAYNTATPLPDLLKMMRKGDVLTHCFNGFSQGILDGRGNLLPAVREARERGVLFDVGFGHISCSFKVAERALQQGFFPDTISSDLSAWATINGSGDLPSVVSTMMALGIDIDQAIERVTVKPSQVFDFGVPLGTLRPGAEADISVFEVREGNFEFSDNSGLDTGGKIEKRVGHQRLVNKAAVCRGQLFVNEL